MSKARVHVSFAHMQEHAEFDLIVLGAGLSGMLAAFSISKKIPTARIAVIEKSLLSEKPRKTWSCFRSDLDAEDLEDLKELISCEWKNFELRFPHSHKKLNWGYVSFLPSHMEKIVFSRPQIQLFENAEVQELKSWAVHTSKGIFNSKLIFDGRGQKLKTFEAQNCAWQTFLGHEIETKKPHGLTTPILMDFQNRPNRRPPLYVRPTMEHAQTPYRRYALSKEVSSSL